MRTKLAAMTLLIALVCGCEPPPVKTPQGAAPKPAVALPEAPQFAPRVAAAGTAAKVSNNVAPGMVREQANAGLTAKGKYSADIITTPVSAYFTVKDQVVFQYQIPKALEYYQLTHGRKPRTYEEFSREIVDKNGIKLPELPPTHRYFYDPDTATLLVEHPAN